MMNSCFRMCVDINADQTQKKLEGKLISVCVRRLCLGVGLHQDTPDPREAHYVLTPWPCVKGPFLPLACGASCLWVCVFRQL